VNGVLRKIAGNIDTIVYPDKDKELASYLSVTYSMPEWIIKRWEKTYSTDTLIQILNGFNEDKKTFIRCNTQKVSPEELKAHLLKENIEVKEVQGIPYAFEISGYDYIGDIDSFQAGEFQIQDISSMMAGEVASPAPGNTIIDVCAAPGGKSINVALKAKNVQVEARDLTEYKVSLIEENINRLGLTNVTARIWDACQVDEQAKETADIVIADLPCSGLGIMGRKPDIRYHVDQDKIKELVKLQREILSVVWEYVKPGGYLIYSTCTIDYEENEKNADWFCEQYPFVMCDLHKELSGCIVDFPENRPIQMLPGIHGTDGFFVAKMRRNEG
jgi:16S rRNA (cytosine967-C5)-methyltransferase